MANFVDWLIAFISHRSSAVCRDRSPFHCFPDFLINAEAEEGIVVQIKSVKEG